MHGVAWIGVTLVLVSFAWQTYRLFKGLGWEGIKKTFGDDPAFLLMLAGALLVLVTAPFL